jgi:hypothetical protein
VRQCSLENDGRRVVAIYPHGEGAPHPLSRRAGGRLPPAAAMPHSTLWQADASGRQRMTDQARNMESVTRLICHRRR